MIGFVLGTVAAIGILIAKSAFGRRERLATLLSDNALELEAPAGGGLDRITAAVLANPTIMGLFSESLRADLTLIGESSHAFVRRIVAIGIAVVALGLLIMSAAGPQGLVIIWLGLLTTVASSVSRVRTAAQHLRTEMLEAVTGFLEFVRLAGQTTSIEGAMREGLLLSDAWPFQRMRTMVAVTDRRGEPPWVAVGELGRRYGIDQLSELGGVLGIASNQSVAVAQAIEAKSATLRRQVTEDEVAAAEAATTTLTIPIAIIGIAIFGLVLTAALMQLTIT